MEGTEMKPSMRRAWIVVSIVTSLAMWIVASGRPVGDAVIEWARADGS